jgi:hypothetical protein
MSEWEDYPKPEASGLGTGLLLPAGVLAATAEDDLNHLALVRVQVGTDVRYYAGAGWTHSGDFTGEADWKSYLGAFAARIGSPLSVSFN